MLTTLRERTKYIMLILAIAFVGWLVFDVGMGMGALRLDWDILRRGRKGLIFVRREASESSR